MQLPYFITDSPILLSAATFAEKAHMGQVRKNTDTPYVTHPIAVSEILFKTIPDIGDEALAAALLHDVVEDTEYTISDIESIFGSTIAYLVGGVTSPTAICSELKKMTRKARKAHDNKVLAAYADYRIHTIKLCDIYHNMSDWKLATQKFLDMYIPEKHTLIGMLEEGDPRMKEKCYDLIGKIPLTTK